MKVFAVTFSLIAMGLLGTQASFAGGANYRPLRPNTTGLVFHEDFCKNMSDIERARQLLTNEVNILKFQVSHMNQYKEHLCMTGQIRFCGPESRQLFDDAKESMEKSVRLRNNMLELFPNHSQEITGYVEGMKKSHFYCSVASNPANQLLLSAHQFQSAVNITAQSPNLSVLDQRTKVINLIETAWKEHTGH